VLRGERLSRETLDLESFVRELATLANDLAAALAHERV
jgi:hypothetical protein